MRSMFYAVVEMITDWVTGMEMSSGLNLMNGDFTRYMKVYEVVTILENIVSASVLVGTILVISKCVFELIKERRLV